MLLPLLHPPGGHDPHAVFKVYLIPSGLDRLGGPRCRQHQPARDIGFDERLPEPGRLRVADGLVADRLVARSTQLDLQHLGLGRIVIAPASRALMPMR